MDYSRYGKNSFVCLYPISFKRQGKVQNDCRIKKEPVKTGRPGRAALATLGRKGESYKSQQQNDVAKLVGQDEPEMKGSLRKVKFLQGRMSTKIEMSSRYAHPVSLSIWGLRSAGEWLPRRSHSQAIG